MVKGDEPQHSDDELDECTVRVVCVCVRVCACVCVCHHLIHNIFITGCW